MLRRLFARRPARLPILAPREAYARLAPTYAPTPHNRLMETEQAAMLRLLPDLAGQDVLDLACGTGRYGQLARARGARRVIGADSSLPMLRVGRLPLAAEATLTALPFAADSFDVILCGLALGHLPPEDLPRALLEIARVLRPDGQALISDFHPYLALSGGARAFTDAQGRRFAVEHHVHLPGDYFAALRAAGLHLLDLDEPRAAPHPGATPLPAALVLRCRRP